jgi:hypothetical protein
MSTGPARLAKGRKAQFPGELVQIDTLTASAAPGVSVKHLSAYDPISNRIAGRVAGSASATSA